jgi:hypothetical protein
MGQLERKRAKMIFPIDLPERLPDCDGKLTGCLPAGRVSLHAVRRVAPQDGHPYFQSQITEYG